LRGIDLHVSAGETIAVTGPSGSGKTTLLQLIGALDRADGGDVRVNGRELGSLDEAARATFRNREIGFVFQAHHLLPQLTALENVLVPAWASRRVEEAQRARAHHLLERVGLAGRMTHFPGQMSGGEQQRVAIARALMNIPPLLLADEPTGNLDSKSTVDIMTFFQSLNEQGQTIVMVTHDTAIARYTKRRIVVRDGKIERIEKT
jgi:putative ABC transport system ATP-binding protein